MKSKKSSRGFKSQGRPDSIPEMELDTLCRLLRSFEIVTDIAENEPYWIRLKGKPYNSFVPGCRSVKVMAHNRGKLVVSPRHIMHILAKFGIDEEVFLEAYEEHLTRPNSEPKPTLADAADATGGRPN